jgi:hypothetical protein
MEYCAGTLLHAMRLAVFRTVERQHATHDYSVLLGSRARSCSCTKHGLFSDLELERAAPGGRRTRAGLWQAGGLWPRARRLTLGSSTPRADPNSLQVGQCWPHRCDEGSFNPDRQATSQEVAGHYASPTLVTYACEEHFAKHACLCPCWS